MAISHELSSEIATALLTPGGKTPRELADLKKIVLEIHSALEGLTEKRHEKPADRLAAVSKAHGSSS